MVDIHRSTRRQHRARGTSGHDGSGAHRSRGGGRAGRPRSPAATRRRSQWPARPPRDTKVGGDLGHRPAESMTASNTAVLRRVVHRALAGTCSDTGVNVRRSQVGSTHISRGLRTTTSIWPACGMSRTRCTLHACTRDDTTPHSGQPSSRSTGCTLIRRPPNGRSTASITRYPGQVEDHARSLTPRARRLEHSSWPFLDGCLNTPISAQGHEPLHQRLTTPNCEVPLCVAGPSSGGGR
jgi:hypothetical protein